MRLKIYWIVSIMSFEVILVKVKSQKNPEKPPKRYINTAHREENNTVINFSSVTPTKNNFFKLAFL